MDTQHAIEVDPSSAAAHAEQGRAFFKLEEFESAKEAFEMASVLEPHRKVHRVWIDQCRAAIGEDLHEASSSIHRQEEPQIGPAADTDRTERRKPAVSVTADDPEYSQYWRVAPPISSGETDAKSSGRAPTSTTTDAGQITRKYRHQWFQSDNKVEVAVLAKKLPKDSVEVIFEPSKLVIRIWADHRGEDTTDARDKSLNGDRKSSPEYEIAFDLEREIVPSESTFEVLTTKIEIRMAKRNPGHTWSSLERSVPDAARHFEESASPAEGLERNECADQEQQPHVAGSKEGTSSNVRGYPSAGTKVNWDEVARQVMKEEEEEELDGDAVRALLTPLHITLISRFVCPHV